MVLDLFAEPKGQQNELVPEFHPLRCKDFPVSHWASLESMMELYRNTVDKRTASSVIINTASCLESSSLSFLQQQQLQIPVYPIGPLHMVASAPTSLLEENKSCIEWLNKQKVNSVIYISMGSIALMEINEIMEDGMVGDGINGIEAVVVVMAVDMEEEMGMDEDMAMAIVAMRMTPCSWMTALLTPYQFCRKKRTVSDVKS